MPRVRVSPLGPKVQNPLLRSLDFSVRMERDSKDQIAICRWHIAATSANTGGYLYLRLPAQMQTSLATQLFIPCLLHKESELPLLRFFFHSVIIIL